MFYRKGVLYFAKIDRKTPVLESLFNKVAKNDSVFAKINERVSQRVISDFFATSNERILKRVTSDILQWAASAISKQQILQRIMSDFTTSYK